MGSETTRVLVEVVRRFLTTGRQREERATVAAWRLSRAVVLAALVGCADGGDGAERQQRDDVPSGRSEDTGCPLELVAEDAEVTCGDYSVSGATVWLDCGGTWWAESADAGVALAADDCVVSWIP